MSVAILATVRAHSRQEIFSYASARSDLLRWCPSLGRKWQDAQPLAEQKSQYGGNCAPQYLNPPRKIVVIAQYISHAEGGESARGLLALQFETFVTRQLALRSVWQHITVRTGVWSLAVFWLVHTRDNALSCAHAWIELGTEELQRVCVKC